MGEVLLALYEWALYAAVKFAVHSSKARKTA